MKGLGLICLVLTAYFVSRAYSRFRQHRYEELEAYCRLLGGVREDILVYRTFRAQGGLRDDPVLCRLGYRGEENVTEDLMGTLSRMSLFPSEKKILTDILHTFGEGNLESEIEKVEKILDNVKIILQKEEKEGKKSVDTVRIVLFTVALSLVIILL